MKRTCAILLLGCFQNFAIAQSWVASYDNPKDTLRNYHIVLKPNVPAKGLLLLFPSYGETPQHAAVETDIPNAATAQGLITVIATLQQGTETFYADDVSQTAIDKLVVMLREKYQVAEKPFYLGGFSLGGTGVVRYAERAYASETMPRPRAVFAVDPPLDFERLFTVFEHIERRDIINQEAHYFIQRIEEEMHGKPGDVPIMYRRISPFSWTDSNFTNVQSLLRCPLRLVSEPDIMWYIKYRQSDFYDHNSIDCAALIKQLSILGNNDAELVLTTGKGHRKSNGRRNPHSWSIADAAETVKWLMKY